MELAYIWNSYYHNMLAGAVIMMIPTMHEKWSEPYDRIIQQGISNTNDQNWYLK